MTARPEALAAFGAALYRLRAARRQSLRRAGAYGTTVGALPGGDEEAS